MYPSGDVRDLKQNHLTDVEPSSSSRDALTPRRYSVSTATDPTAGREGTDEPLYAFIACVASCGNQVRRADASDDDDPIKQQKKVCLETNASSTNWMRIGGSVGEQEVKSKAAQIVPCMVG